MSGYVDCACGTCFEIAIADDDQPYAFCHACEEAGCEPDGECQCDHEDELACPGCGCLPGDGRTPGCAHPTGCGYIEADGAVAPGVGIDVGGSK